MPSHPLHQIAAAVPRSVFVRVIAFYFLLLEPELRELKHFVPPGKTAIDIGTWWGPWSWWLARMVPNVEAFEPNASICRGLEGVLPANVHLHDVALSDRKGQSVLWSPSGDIGTEGRSTLIAQPRSSWVKQDVEVATLDEYAFSNVGFVKIDVEGLELEVLRGAANLIEKERPNIFIEVEDAHHPGDHVDEVFDFISGFGYTGTYLDGKTWRPVESFDRVQTRQRGERNKQMGIFQALFARGRERYINNFLFVPPGEKSGRERQSAG
jgi:FkbM family methyltransferase